MYAVHSRCILAYSHAVNVKHVVHVLSKYSDRLLGSINPGIDREHERRSYIIVYY